MKREEGGGREVGEGADFKEPSMHVREFGLSPIYQRFPDFGISFFLSFFPPLFKIKKKFFLLMLRVYISSRHFFYHQKINRKLT